MLFGREPFGRVPFGRTSYVLFDHDAMLSDNELVHTVALTVWDIENDVEETLYFASEPWATAPTDIPASTPFDGRLKTVLEFQRSVADGTRPGLNHTAGEGKISFSNADGAYDTTVDEYTPRDRVVVRIGRKSDAFADHLVIFDGEPVDWSANRKEVTIKIRDKGFRLDVPASPNVYAGTGDEEGGDDLKGKRKPRCFGGFVFGVQPTLIDPVLYIYQANDGPVEELNLVYDRGVLLLTEANVADYAALVASAPSPGNMVPCWSLGMFKLGAAPDGLIFCTVVRPPHETQDIIRELLIDTAGLTADEIDQASFDAVAVALAGRTVTLFIGPDDSSTVADVVNSLMAGIGGWGGFDRQGKFAIGVFSYPDGDPVAYFREDEGDIIDLEREPMPSGVWPPPWRWRVAWKRAWTVFTDFAASVSDAERSIYAQPYRLKPDTGFIDVRADFPKAQDTPPVEAYFDDESHALAEANRLLALYGSGNSWFYRFVATRSALHPRIKIGAPIHVTHSRYGLSAGKKMRIASIEDSIRVDAVERVTIVAYGSAV